MKPLQLDDGRGVEGLLVGLLQERVTGATLWRSHSEARKVFKYLLEGAEFFGQN